MVAKTPRYNKQSNTVVCPLHVIVPAKTYLSNVSLTMIAVDFHLGINAAIAAVRLVVVAT